ncbi:MAG: DUF3298 and DUF4163 domain-containing protein [Deltaproteobacteria bacterium]|jgi:hypothetical protein|nr:DUF3298 and DUF4163 domain-containing protein [Deltaproteobacteria bacterium]
MKKHSSAKINPAVRAVLTALSLALLFLPACSPQNPKAAGEDTSPPAQAYSVLGNTAALPAQNGADYPPDHPAQNPAGPNFPEELYQTSNSCFKLELRAPFTGNELIDEQIGSWEEALRNDAARSFTKACAARSGSVRSNYGEPDYSLEVTHETSSTPGGVISVLFLPSTYTGGAHPVTEVVTMNFHSQTGQKLAYSDIFADTRGLLSFLSAHARKVFRPTLGAFWDANPDMAEGLEAEPENLSSFVLNPQGLVLIFPPYQIAPYSEGIQSCLVPLDLLLRFKPKPGIWN